MSSSGGRLAGFTALVLPALPWVAACAMICVAALLFAQAAFIRGRLDTMAPGARASPDVPQCTASTLPALRAYALKVNTRATLALAIDPQVQPTIVATHQVGTCGLDPEPAYIPRGTFPAKWLVLKGGPAGAGAESLQFDCVGGRNYVVAMRNTYVVVAAPGSAAEINARKSVGALAEPKDIFLAVQTVARVNADFTASSTSAPQQRQCRLAVQNAPIMSNNQNVDSLYAALALASVASAAPYLLHVWGYAGGTSSSSTSGATSSMRIM